MSRKSKILSNAELSAFCQQISLIIAAGLPTYYGVSILCDEAPDKQTHGHRNYSSDDRLPYG